MRLDLSGKWKTPGVLLNKFSLWLKMIDAHQIISNLIFTQVNWDRTKLLESYSKLWDPASKFSPTPFRVFLGWCCHVQSGPKNIIIATKVSSLLSISIGSQQKNLISLKIGPIDFDVKISQHQRKNDPSEKELTWSKIFKFNNHSHSVGLFTKGHLGMSHFPNWNRICGPPVRIWPGRCPPALGPIRIRSRANDLSIT